MFNPVTLQTEVCAFIVTGQDGKQRKDQEAQKQQLDTWSLLIWDQNRLPRRIEPVWAGTPASVSVAGC